MHKRAEITSEQAIEVGIRKLAESPFGGTIRVPTRQAESKAKELRKELKTDDRKKVKIELADQTNPEDIDATTPCTINVRGGSH